MDNTRTSENNKDPSPLWEIRFAVLQPAISFTRVYTYTYNCVYECVRSRLCFWVTYARAICRTCRLSNTDRKRSNAEIGFFPALTRTGFSGLSINVYGNSANVRSRLKTKKRLRAFSFRFTDLTRPADGGGSFIRISAIVFRVFRHGYKHLFVAVCSKLRTRIFIPRYRPGSNSVAGSSIRRYYRTRSVGVRSVRYTAPFYNSK